MIKPDIDIEFYLLSYLRLQTFGLNLETVKVKKNELKWMSHCRNIRSARHGDIIFSQEFELLSKRKSENISKDSGPDSEFKTQYCLCEMRLNIQDVLTT